MKVINLFGGPGSGKSSAMFGLAYLMKINGHRVEVNHEYVKRFVYEGTLNTLSFRQDEILSNQNKGLDIFKRSNKIDYVITDSPILLTCVYADQQNDDYKEICDLAKKKFLCYDNINVYLERPSTFIQEGRVHNEEESKHIDIIVLNLLNETNLPYTMLKSNRDIDKTLYGLIMLKEIKKVY